MENILPDGIHFMGLGKGLISCLSFGLYHRTLLEQNSYFLSGTIDIHRNDRIVKLKGLVAIYNVSVKGRLGRKLWLLGEKRYSNKKASSIECDHFPQSWRVPISARYVCVRYLCMEWHLTTQWIHNPSFNVIKLRRNEATRTRLPRLFLSLTKYYLYEIMKNGER